LPSDLSVKPSSPSANASGASRNNPRDIVRNGRLIGL
jgi:hypothetical protein